MTGPLIYAISEDAVAAANIFHFKELSDRNAKRTMNKAGIPVRL
jgi:imidazole glycerol phosphate synthase subunit HisF